MTGLWLGVVAASLAGSLHCVAMCGPFAAAGTGGRGRERLFSQLAYHSGRLFTYAALGALAGSLGAALNLAGSGAGLAGVSALVSGVLLLLWGASGFFSRSRLVRLGTEPRTGLGSVLGRVLVRLARRSVYERALVLGLATTLLPCGWLYAFVLTAAGSGSPLGGFLVMVAFWAGSVPLLFGAALGLKGWLARLGPRARAVSTSLIAVGGLALILGRVLGEPRPSLEAPGRSDAKAAADAPCPLHGR